VHIRKSVIFNFVGGGWTAALIVLTTPLYVARVGLEGFGLIGFWQLLLYVSLVLDFGLGAACSREFSRYIGALDARGDFRALLACFERPIVFISIGILLLLMAAGPWLGTTWLQFTQANAQEAGRALAWVPVSVACQFVIAFYLNALAGLQRQGLMNALQIFVNSVRYLGGAAVLMADGGLGAFFVFQAFGCVFSVALVRWALLKEINALNSPALGRVSETVRLGSFLRFSGGMFFTAACGALISNADRLAISKLMPAEALGKYSVCLTAIGLLQMFILAFHRAYFPKFSELSAAGDSVSLRRTYLMGSSFVGLAVVPASVFVCAFAPDLFTLWLGWENSETTMTARLLTIGFAMSGLMWLPAAYQQAIGWTRLHATLMAVSLLVGVPLMLLAVTRLGLAGGAFLLLAHGFIEITLGLWLMNKRCFPGENWTWYRCVVVVPLMLSLPIIVCGFLLMPDEPSLIARAGLLFGTAAVLLLALVVAGRMLLRQVGASS